MFHGWHVLTNLKAPCLERSDGSAVEMLSTPCVVSCKVQPVTAEPQHQTLPPHSSCSFLNQDVFSVLSTAKFDNIFTEEVLLQMFGFFTLCNAVLESCSLTPPKRSSLQSREGMGTITSRGKSPTHHSQFSLCPMSRSLL